MIRNLFTYAQVPRFCIRWLFEKARPAMGAVVVRNSTTYRQVLRFCIAVLLAACSLPDDEATYPYAGWAQTGSSIECYNADYRISDGSTTICRWDCADVGDGSGQKVNVTWDYDGCAWTLVGEEYEGCDGFFDQG